MSSSARFDESSIRRSLLVFGIVWRYFYKTFNSSEGQAGQIKCRECDLVMVRSVRTHGWMHDVFMCHHQEGCNTPLLLAATFQEYGLSIPSKQSAHDMMQDMHFLSDF